jgi:hypothetical protein
MKCKYDTIKIITLSLFGIISVYSSQLENRDTLTAGTTGSASQIQENCQTYDAARKYLESQYMQKYNLIKEPKYLSEILSYAENQEDSAGFLRLSALSILCDYYILIDSGHWKDDYVRNINKKAKSKVEQISKDPSSPERQEIAQSILSHLDSWGYRHG